MLFVCAARPAAAQQIPSLPDLQTLLGAGGETDNFTAYTIAAGAADDLGTAVLNAATMANGQGPGLVNGDLTFTNEVSPNNGANGSTLNWDGAGHIGNGPEGIQADGGQIAITFAGTVDAFGVDLTQTDFGLGPFGPAQPTTAIVDVYDASNDLLTTESFALASDGSATFYGYETQAAPIALVTITHTGEPGFDHPRSPELDDVTYGPVVPAAAPEPGSCALALLGGLAGLAVIRRRRIAVR
jgi:MYXO-CTERM domain-containing protein